MNSLKPVPFWRILVPAFIVSGMIATAASILIAKAEYGYDDIGWSLSPDCQALHDLEEDPTPMQVKK